MPKLRDRAVADSAAPVESMSADLLEDGVVSVREAAEFVGLSRSALYQLMAAGDLQFVKIGRRRLVPKRALIALLARSLQVSSEDETLNEMGSALTR